MSNKKKKETMNINTDEMSDKAKSLLMEIDADRKKCVNALNDVVTMIDKWSGLLVIDDVNGKTVKIQIRDANLQRGGGGKRTRYKYNGVVYESGKALCDALKIDVAGDSAVRKLERYAKENPDVKFTIVDNK